MANTIAVEKSHFKSLSKIQRLNFLRWIYLEYAWFYEVGPMVDSVRKWYMGGLR
jgi:hypothetical protein